MRLRKVLRSIDEPSDSLLFNRAFSSNCLVLKCPVCGDQYSHVQGGFSLLGDDESRGGYPGIPTAGTTPWRRDALAVRVHGETCGHQWDMVFQQHKGETRVRIDVLEDGSVAEAVAVEEGKQ
jgi:hypothetical protein